MNRCTHTCSKFLAALLMGTFFAMTAPHADRILPLHVASREARVLSGPSADIGDLRGGRTFLQGIMRFENQVLLPHRCAGLQVLGGLCQIGLESWKEGRSGSHTRSAEQEYPSNRSIKLEDRLYITGEKSGSDYDCST